MKNSEHIPPNLPLRFFRWFCHPEYVEDIEGDLLERFEKRVEEHGAFKAKWHFIKDIILLFRLGLIRPTEGHYRLNYYGMFKNDLKIALRNLKRHKTYVIINLLGMGFALMCCIVAFLNLDYKLRFDEHHSKKTDRVYRVNTIRSTEAGKEAWGLSPVALAPALSNEVTGIEHVVRLDHMQGLINVNNKSFAETIHYADMDLLEIFNFPLLYGNASALQNREMIVLSQETAFKYFGYEDPVGQEVILFDGSGNKKTFTIGAVTKKVPENSSILFDVLIPFDHLIEHTKAQEAYWKSPSQISVFIKITSGVDPAIINEQLENYVTINNSFREDFQVAGFYVQPFMELAFSSDIDLPGWVRGRALNRNAVGFVVGITTFLSLMILLTACFNFTNTAIAFSGNRLKEIGIRKVIGGSRIQLVKQFMVENLVLCFLSILIGLLGVHFLIDAYNGLFEQNLDMRYVFHSRVLLFLLSFPLLTAILAGAYPAFKISGHHPVTILKGKTRFARMGWLSKILLTSQFSVACFAIIGCIVLTQNAEYQQHLDFGYDLRKVAVTSINEPEMFEVYENEVLKNPKIQRVAGSSDIIGMSEEALVKTHLDEQEKTVRQLRIGSNYLQTVGIELVSGRDFVATSAQDLEKSVIINQKMVDELNLTDGALDKEIFINENPYHVIGIAENHKEFGLRQEEPACLFTLVDPSQFQFMSVGTSEENRAEIADFLIQTWFQVNPTVPYNGFSQEMLIYKQLYMNTVIRNLCLFLAIAILIMSAAGFFSIVSLSVQKRTKEIGIRKVFGGSIAKMIHLILRDFVMYIIVAFIIGSVLGGLVIHAVLFSNMYVYHTPFSLWAFVLTLLIMLLVPGATVGLKVYRAATANPANTLKYE